MEEIRATEEKFNKVQETTAVGGRKYEIVQEKTEEMETEMSVIWRKKTIESPEENNAGRHVTNILGPKRNSWLM